MLKPVIKKKKEPFDQQDKKATCREETGSKTTSARHSISPVEDLHVSWDFQNSNRFEQCMQVQLQLKIRYTKVIFAGTFYNDLESMKVQQLWILTLHAQSERGKRVSSGSIPVKVSVHGLIPASLFEVPKSEIFNTPLYVLISTLSP